MSQWPCEESTHVYGFMNVFTNLVMKCEGNARKAGPLYFSLWHYNSIRSTVTLVGKTGCMSKVTKWEKLW